LKDSFFLGFDYGEKTIGVAIGNSRTGQARPLTTLAVHRQQPDWAVVTRLIENWQPAALIVGLPLNMDDSANPMTKLANKFGKRLAGRYNLPIYMVDERLTSREASMELSDAGISVIRHKEKVDEIAAQSILQTFLNDYPEARIDPQG
jgi:putative Holliday junction resolvase